MVRLSCPSCNSSFTLAELPAERRAPCPRCGDVFPVRSWDEVAGPESPARSTEVPTPTRRDRARWSVQRTVAVALVLGLAGLLTGLFIRSTGGGQKPPVGVDQPAPIAAVPATELIGVGYLPADASLVFALQPGPVVAHAARAKQDPYELLKRAGLPQQVLDGLTGSGLALDQIDHIAGAVNVDGLRLTLVLVVRRPIDEERFLKRIRARRSNDGKERYSVEVRGLPLSLARVSDTIWVFGFDAKKDLDAVDRGGHGPGGHQFAPALSGMIARVPSDAALWIATDDDNWSEKPLVKMVIGEIANKPQWLAALARIRAVVATLSLGEPPRLHLFVKAADVSAGERIRSYFQTRAANAESASAGGSGELAYFETPIDLTAASTILRDMLNEAVKP